MHLSLSEVWVGVKARKWLDGRIVTQSEWNFGEPNGSPDICARMVSKSPYILADTSCSNNLRFLCVRKVV